MIWILIALLVIFLALGIWAFCFTFLGEPLPDLTDPQVLEQPRWKPYREMILEGRRWMDGQQIKPLHVMSYDGKMLYGQFIPCENARGTILMFSGYHSTYAVDFSIALEYYHSLGMNLLLCDPRAHGNSGGKVITFGAKERYDVLSWVTYLSLMLGEDHPMILDGMSMGATTVLLASELEFPANVCGVIADSGFTAGSDIIRQVAKTRFHLPPGLTVGFLNIFTNLFAGFSLYQSSAVDAVRNTKLPILLLHGSADPLVPCEMAHRIYDACGGPKTLVEVPDAGHGGSYVKDMPRCRAALRDFLDAVLGSAEP